MLLWSSWGYGSFLRTYLIKLTSKINHNINRIWKINISTLQVRNALCTIYIEKSWKLILFKKLHWKSGAKDSTWLIFSKKYHYDLLRPLEAVLDFISKSWSKMNFCCLNHCVYSKYFIHRAKCTGSVSIKWTK